MKGSNVALTISLTAVNLRKLMFFQLSVQWMFWISGIPVSWIFFGLFYNITENIVKFFFSNMTCRNFFVDGKPSWTVFYFLLCGEALLTEIFFPLFYNIRKDTKIIILQSNVRKMYVEPKTVWVNSYDFFMPQQQLLVS